MVSFSQNDLAFPVLGRGSFFGLARNEQIPIQRLQLSKKYATDEPEA
jgi:hypothetical protein